MPYATKDDLLRVLNPDGEAYEGTAAYLPEATLEGLIDDAEAEVDARLAPIYDTPFSDPAPKLVQWVVVSLAAYHAQLISLNTRDLEERDPFQLRLNKAERMLSGLAEQELVLPDYDGPSYSMDPMNVFDEPLFTKDYFDLPDPSAAEAAERDTYQWEGWPYGF